MCRGKDMPINCKKLVYNIINSNPDRYSGREPAVRVTAEPLSKAHPYRE